MAKQIMNANPASNPTFVSRVMPLEPSYILKSAISIAQLVLESLFR